MGITFIILHYQYNTNYSNRHHLKYNQIVSPFLKTVKFVPQLTYSNNTNPNQTQNQYTFPSRVIEAGLFPVSHMTDILLNRLTTEPTADVIPYLIKIDK